MLSSAASANIAPKAAAQPPAARPGLPANAPAAGPTFAQFLNDQPDPPAPADPQAASREGAAPATPAASRESQAAPAVGNANGRRKETNPPAAKANPAAAPRAKETGTSAAEARPADPASAHADAASKLQDSDEAADAAESADEVSAQDPSLAEFAQLIGLAVPADAQAGTRSASTAHALAEEAESGAIGASGKAKAGAGETDAEGIDGAATGTRHGAKADTPNLSGAADRRPGERAAAAADSQRARSAEQATDKASLAARLTGTDALQASAARMAEAPTPRIGGVPEAGAPNFAALMAAALPGSVAGADTAPTPAAGRVHAAVHSAAFAPELAANVSLLAADGIQHAELQLNPAEMGPVAVQIIVDGTQAQVSFHAVQAETRQALEQSLPDLAAALQGQGLTLSGGGVFQQARRDAQAGSEEPGAGNGRGGRTTGGVDGPTGAAAGTATVSVRRTAGLLDTFA